MTSQQVGIIKYAGKTGEDYDDLSKLNESNVYRVFQKNVYNWVWRDSV